MKRNKKVFTLMELLVVVVVMVILVAILLPALSGGKKESNTDILYQQPQAAWIGQQQVTMGITDVLLRPPLKIRLPLLAIQP